MKDSSFSLVRAALPFPPIPGSAESDAEARHPAHLHLVRRARIAEALGGSTPKSNVARRRESPSPRRGARGSWSVARPTLGSAGLTSHGVLPWGSHMPLWATTGYYLPMRRHKKTPGLAAD